MVLMDRKIMCVLPYLCHASEMVALHGGGPSDLDSGYNRVVLPCILLHIPQLFLNQILLLAVIAVLGNIRDCLKYWKGGRKCPELLRGGFLEKIP